MVHCGPTGRTADRGQRWLSGSRIPCSPVIVSIRRIWDEAPRMLTVRPDSRKVWWVCTSAASPRTSQNVSCVRSTTIPCVAWEPVPSLMAVVWSASSRRSAVAMSSSPATCIRRVSPSCVTSTSSPARGSCTNSSGLVCTLAPPLADQAVAHRGTTPGERYRADPMRHSGHAAGYSPNPHTTYTPVNWPDSRGSRGSFVPARGYDGRHRGFLVCHQPGRCRSRFRTTYAEPARREGVPAGAGWGTVLDPESPASLDLAAGRAELANLMLAMPSLARLLDDLAR